jgi:hypothetical protein
MDQSLKDAGKTDLCKTIELDGERKLQDLIDTNTLTESNLTQIINQGNDEFKNATGRNMTYSEMRSMFG